MPDTELQLAMSQLFGSPLCERLLASCVREICLTRLDVARDILLLISLLQHGEVYSLILFCGQLIDSWYIPCPIHQIQGVEQSHLSCFSSLMYCYRCLYWLSCRLTIPASPSSLWVSERTGLCTFTCTYLLIWMCLGMYFLLSKRFLLCNCMYFCLCVPQGEQFASVSGSQYFNPFIQTAPYELWLAYMVLILLYMLALQYVYYMFLHLFLSEDCSVLELYIHGVGGQRLRKTLLGTGVVPNGAVVFSTWTDLLPKTLSILLEQLYP